jgi:GTP cyclohydrolase IB
MEAISSSEQEAGIIEQEKAFFETTCLSPLAACQRAERAMKDVQSFPADVALAIDRVGVKSLRLPLLVRDRSKGRQHTVAQVDISVDLPAEFKGTHMSRFIEVLSGWSGVLDYTSLKGLLASVQEKLQARRSHLCFRFPYFQEQLSPMSRSSALMDYTSFLSGELEGSDLTMIVGVEVPVMTVCPCSLAICEEGAHSQRSMVRIQARFEGLLWLEDLIRIAQESASSPVYALLKREDEKHVTEQAFAQPFFVEDVVRNVAKRLLAHELVLWFQVEVESFESIHNHSAYACIERSKDGSGRKIS